MLATLQLILALGLGRSAVAADLVATVAVLAGVTLVARRRARTAPRHDVVVEAEAVVRHADQAQPV